MEEMNGDWNYPGVTMERLEKVTTVGELIRQLQRFDEATHFSPHQRVMHVKAGEKEWVVITEVEGVK